MENRVSMERGPLWAAVTVFLDGVEFGTQADITETLRAAMIELQREIIRRQSNRKF